MTYKLCKRVIENTSYTSQEHKNEMQKNLDVFLLNNRLDEGEYTELTALLAAKEIVA